MTRVKALESVAQLSNQGGGDGSSDGSSPRKFDPNSGDLGTSRPYSRSS